MNEIIISKELEKDIEESALFFDMKVETIKADFLTFCYLKKICFLDKRVLVKGSTIYKKALNLYDLPPKDIDLLINIRARSDKKIKLFRSLMSKCNIDLTREPKEVFQVGKVFFEKDNIGIRIEYLANTKINRLDIVKYMYKSILYDYYIAKSLVIPDFLKPFELNTYSINSLISSKICSLSMVFSLDMTVENHIKKIMNVLYDFYLLSNTRDYQLLINDTKLFKKHLLKEYKNDLSLQVSYYGIYKHSNEILDNDVFDILKKQHIKEKFSNFLMLNNYNDIIDIIDKNLELIKKMIKNSEIEIFLKKQQKKYNK